MAYIDPLVKRQDIARLEKYSKSVLAEYIVESKVFGIHWGALDGYRCRELLKTFRRTAQEYDRLTKMVTPDFLSALKNGRYTRAQAIQATRIYKLRQKHNRLWRQILKMNKSAQGVPAKK